MKRFAALIIAALALLAFLILLFGWIRNEPQAAPLQGEIEMGRVDVSSKVPGRLVTVHIRRGDRVEMGDPLIELDGPELRAQLLQAESAQTAADAQRRQRRARASRSSMRHMQSGKRLFQRWRWQNAPLSGSTIYTRRA